MKLKKLVSCAAAAMAALSLISAPIHAASVNSVIDPGKKASLTIHKIRENSGTVYVLNGKENQSITNEGMEGISFGALKIAEISQVVSGRGAGTWFTGLDSGFAALAAQNGVTIESETRNGVVTYDPDDLQSALHSIEAVSGTEPGDLQLTNYVKQAAAAKHFEPTDGSGTAVLTNLPLGLYLVVEEDYSGYSDSEGTAEEMIHNPASPFLVSLPMTDGESSETAGTWLYDVTVYPKNQTVSIPKYIVKESDDDTLVQSDDFEIGETITQVIAPGAPAVTQLAAGSNARAYEKYVVTDRMEEGLSFVSIESVRFGDLIDNPAKLSDFESFSILENGVDYRVLKGESGSVLLNSENAAGTKVFRIELLERGLAKLNEGTNSAQIAVIFKAVLTKDAKDGSAEANTNRPSLTIKNRNTKEYSINGNEPGVYTYRLNINKTGVEDASKVSFSVHRGKTLMTFVKENEGIYHVYDHDLDEAESVSRLEAVRPASDGTLQIRGLDADSYEFTELTTENGHELMKSSFTVTLTGKDPVDGMLADAVIEADGGHAQIGISAGTAGFAVDNVKSLVLRTGGKGTALFYIFGVLIMLTAGIVVLVNRRRIG